MTAAPRAPVGVASRDRVRTGVAGGSAPPGHGEAAPMAWPGAGGWIVCGSPRTGMGDRKAVLAFAAIGQIPDCPPRPAAMGGEITAMRRQVAFLAAAVAPIRPLLRGPSFTRHRRNRGHAFFHRAFAILPGGRAVIAGAMEVAAA